MTSAKTRISENLNDRERAELLHGQEENQRLSPADLSLAKHKIETDGYWIFQGHDTEPTTLTALADCFGQRQRHVLVDEAGIHAVSTQSSGKNTTIAEPQYIGNTNQEHKPHTDGVYLNGVVKNKDNRLVAVQPPKLTLMQMVQPAAQGGASVVVDCKPLLERALQCDRDLVVTCLKPCAIYSRDDQCTRTSVFTPIAPGTWSVRWRYDFTTLVAAEACTAFQRFYEKYICDPQYVQHFYLEPGQILVVDNLRMLHGREAFCDWPERPRLLRRVWVADSEQAFVNPLGKAKHRRVFDQYEPYSYLNLENQNSLVSVSAGIRLSAKSQGVAEQLLLQAI